MNLLQLLILIAAAVAAGWIVWQDLPLEIPLVIFKALMLFVKLFIALALAIAAYLFAGRMKRS